MLDREACGCLFCRGEDGRRLVPIAYEIAEAAGLIDAAKRDRVTVKATDDIFVVEGYRAVACIRQLRRHTARLCGCWVAKDSRGIGLGSILVRHRLAFIESHMSVKAADTFAFRRDLFLRLGFESRAGYKIGTTCLRKVLDR